MTSPTNDILDMPTIRIPREDPPTPEERTRDNKIIIAAYVGVHVLLFFLPLPVMMMLAVVLVVSDVIVSYEVCHKISDYLNEHPYMRNLRLLNPFHYKPDLQGRIVEAFVETIAPDTTQELHTD